MWPLRIPPKMRAAACPALSRSPFPLPQFALSVPKFPSEVALLRALLLSPLAHPGLPAVLGDAGVGAHSWVMGTRVSPTLRRAGRAACQAGIQMLGEAGGFSRAPQ